MPLGVLEPPRSSARCTLSFRTHIWRTSGVSLQKSISAKHTLKFRFVEISGGLGTICSSRQLSPCGFRVSVRRPSVPPGRRPSYVRCTLVFAHWTCPPDSRQTSGGINWVRAAYARHPSGVSLSERRFQSPPACKHNSVDKLCVAVHFPSGYRPDIERISHGSGSVSVYKSCYCNCSSFLR